MAPSGSEPSVNLSQIYIGKEVSTLPQVDITSEDAESVASTEVDLPSIGVVSLADSSCYLGQHVLRKRTGLGICKYPNGDLFQGNWKEDVKHGLGCYLFACSDNRFEGEFCCDRIQGRGRLLWSDGSLHVGEFVDHRPHGLALFQAADGTTYLGQFEAGRFSMVLQKWRKVRVRARVRVMYGWMWNGDWG